MTGATRLLLPLLFGLLAGTIFGAPEAFAVSWYAGKHPDKDRIVFTFDDAAPAATIERDGSAAVIVRFPKGFKQPVKAPTGDPFAGAERVKSVTPIPGGLRIELKTPGVVFSKVGSADPKKLVLDFATDQTAVKPAEPQVPKSPETKPAPKPEAKPTALPSGPPTTPGPAQPSAKPASPGADTTPAVQDDGGAPIPFAPDQTSKPEPDKAPPPAQEAGKTVLPEPPPQTRSAPPAKRPYFSVPYYYRAPLGAPPSAGGNETSEPAIPDGLGGLGSATVDLARPESVEVTRSETLMTGERSVSEVKRNPQDGSALGVRARIARPGEEGQSFLNARAAPKPYVPAGVANQSGQTPPPVAPIQPLPATAADDAAAAKAPGLAPPAAPEAQPDRQGRQAIRRTPEAPLPGLSAANQTSSIQADAPQARPATDSAQGGAGSANASAASGGPPPASSQNASRAADQTPPVSAPPAPGAKGGKDDKKLATPDGIPLKANGVPDFDSAMFEAKSQLAEGEFGKAQKLLTAMRDHPDLPFEMQEEVLYTLADLSFSINREVIPANFDELVKAYTRAVNFNKDSLKIPEAYIKLGQINLAVGNLREAQAYFNLLKMKFPRDGNIPTTHMLLGEYWAGKKDWTKAAEEFGTLVQTYPDNKLIRDASLGLANALSNLDKHAEALQILDFLGKRFPRYYEENPQFLLRLAQAAQKTGDAERARANYWTYYNINPKSEDADMVLAKLGDVYLETGRLDPAKTLYQRVKDEFPKSKWALVAAMRLAEQGVYDAPTLNDLGAVFDKKFTASPVDVYQRIVKEHPDSELAPQAQMKLVLWRLWNKDYKQTLKDAGVFLAKYGSDPLANRVKEAAVEALVRGVDANVADDNSDGAIKLVDDNPFVKELADLLPPQTHLSLGLAYKNAGFPKKALEKAERLLNRPGMPALTELSLKLALSTYLDNKDWNAIIDLEDRAKLWELSDKTRAEYDYALALAFENTKQRDKAAPIWKTLAARPDLEPNRKAYAAYFQALKARADNDAQTAYDLAKESLALFKQSGEGADKAKDLLGVLLDVTEAAGKNKEALLFAVDYAKAAPKGDPDWAAARWRLAQLYKKMADEEQWRKILVEIRDAEPGTLYGRMADSDLKTRDIENRLKQFTPVGRM